MIANTRSRCAAKILSESRHRHLSRHLQTERIHGIDAGGENHIRSCLFQAVLVAFERARICIKVFTHTELRWINKNTDDDPLGMLTSKINQGKVTGMQISHGWHESYVFLMVPPGGGLLDEFVFGVRN